MRPVIVKLRTTWDKRLILNGCKKLKDFPTRIFVAADETLEARRKRTLQRIKLRAEQEHKIVDVSDGVLIIDGIRIFSLSKGKLSQDGQ